jgi:hypothetical protein
MKILYSFDVERQVEKEIPHIRKTKDGPVETTKKVKESIKNKVFFRKPSVAQLEEADFFYGQQFNEHINAGFLTKAMLVKKMGDLGGGLTSKRSQDILGELVAENIEAAKTIEFFGGSEDLDEEQKKQLKEAKEKYTLSAKGINEMESDIRGQFNQTADSKAEQKLIEWLVINFSYYEDQLKEKGKTEGKKETFPLFEGENYNEKRSYLIALQEDVEEITESSLLKAKKIFDESFEILIRVASIWYNKLGSDQESIGKILKELFDESDEKESLPDS